MTRTCLILVALLLAVPGSAAETVVRQQKGPATLELRFDAKLSVADMIQATLVLEVQADDEISLPRALPMDSKWLLVERLPEEHERLPGGRIRWRQGYRFAPKEPGEWPFLFPEVKRRNRKGEEELVVWDAITIAVAAPTVAPDLGALRGVPGIEVSPPVTPPAPPSPWWRLAAALPGLAALAWIVRRWLRRRSPVSALDRARYELDRLRAMKSIPGERFITLLSMLLREYLERAFDWPARRQTTPELLERCARTEFGPEEKQFLVEFFQRSEAVKFAAIGITPEECAGWIERTRRFLDGCGQAGGCAKTGKSGPIPKNG